MIEGGETGGGGGGGGEDKLSVSVYYGLFHLAVAHPNPTAWQTFGKLSLKSEAQNCFNDAAISRRLTCKTF